MTNEQSLLEQLRCAGSAPTNSGIGHYWDLLTKAADEIERLWACVRAADRLHEDTMYKWAPEAKDAYMAARSTLAP